MGSKVKWIIQKNLINEKVLNQLKDAVIKNNAVYEEVFSIPFSQKLEYQNSDKDTKIVVYGSTTLMLNAYENEFLKAGFFFDRNLFQMSNYITQWKQKNLNSDALIIPLKDFLSHDFQPEKKFFIRPNDDTKSFSGMVISYSDFINSFSNLDDQNPNINNQTLIAIAEPKAISKEW